MRIRPANRDMGLGPWGWVRMERSDEKRAPVQFGIKIDGKAVVTFQINIRELNQQTYQLRTMINEYETKQAVNHTRYNSILDEAKRSTDQQAELISKLEALENEKARAKEILEILKRTEDIADANSKRNLTFPTSPPSPPHQRLNPFSRKEKYDSRKIAENPKKIEIEKRKISIWTTQKTPVNYAQFEDFYTT